MECSQGFVRARLIFHVSALLLDKSGPPTHAQPCGAADSWLRRNVFPRIVCDLVGKSDDVFRPSKRNGKFTLEQDVNNLCTRTVEHYIPQASETPDGRFWKEVHDEIDERLEENLTRAQWEEKLPFYEVYVYSSDFLAGVMLLFLEVLAHYKSVTYTFLACGHWALKETGEVLITALTLQTMCTNGKSIKGSDDFVKASIEYWEQPRAMVQLQVAMLEMDWPSCLEPVGGSPSAKKRSRR
jgi:hypothetical protein